MTRATPSSPSITSWIVALVFSLLFAQFAGLQHRVEHAGWQDGRQAGQSDQAGASQKNTHHSCTIFDAATLADSVGFTPACFVAAALDYAVAPVHAITSWDAPLRPHFQPRAPPLDLVVN